MGTLLCSLETCSLSQVVAFRSRVFTSTFRNVGSALSATEMVRYCSRWKTTLPSPLMLPGHPQFVTLECVLVAGVAQRSLPSRTQLSEGSLLK